MAKIAQYFASGKITPDNTGTSAWETAGRRIGPLYEQQAEGERQFGQALAKLWEGQKIGLDTVIANRRGGGGGGGRGGSAHDALDFGAKSSWGNGIVPFGGRDNGDLEAVGPRLNAAAHTDISRGASDVTALAAKLVSGQGLTDAEYQKMGMTPRGAQLAFNATNNNRAGGYGIYDKEKGAITPTPDVSDEDAAKHGFDVQGQPPPAYPWGPNQFGPEITGPGQEPKVGVTNANPNLQGGESFDPNAPGNSNTIGGAPISTPKPDLSNLPQSGPASPTWSPTDYGQTGQSIWNSINSKFLGDGTTTAPNAVQQPTNLTQSSDVTPQDNLNTQE